MLPKFSSLYLKAGQFHLVPGTGLCLRNSLTNGILLWKRSREETSPRSEGRLAVPAGPATQGIHALYAFGKVHGLGTGEEAHLILPSP